MLANSLSNSVLSTHKHEFFISFATISRTVIKTRPSVDTLNKAAATMSLSSGFPLFPSLPHELRDMIWQKALPEKLHSAIYFYRYGFWRCRMKQKGDRLVEHGISIDGKSFIPIESHDDFLDDIKYELPLAFVNHETRSIALEWAQETNLKTLLCRDATLPVFVRPFNSKIDALYVAAELWENFLEQPYEMDGTPAYGEETAELKCAVNRLALSKRFFECSGFFLPSVCKRFFKTLLLIDNELPHRSSMSLPTEIKPQSELVSMGKEWSKRSENVHQPSLVHC